MLRRAVDGGGLMSGFYVFYFYKTQPALKNHSAGGVLHSTVVYSKS